VTTIQRLKVAAWPRRLHPPKGRTECSVTQSLDADARRHIRLRPAAGLLRRRYGGALPTGPGRNLLRAVVEELRPGALGPDQCLGDLPVHARRLVHEGFGVESEQVRGFGHRQEERGEVGEAHHVGVKLVSKVGDPPPTRAVANHDRWLACPAQLSLRLRHLERRNSQPAILTAGNAERCELSRPRARVLPCATSPRVPVGFTARISTLGRHCSEA
jgi:hypothetical protein